MHIRHWKFARPFRAPQVEDVLVMKERTNLDVAATRMQSSRPAVCGDNISCAGNARDLQFVDLRGNVPTRLRKLIENDWDAIVLARAGLERLGYDLSESRFRLRGTIVAFRTSASRTTFLPAGGQGVIALASTNRRRKL